MDIFAIIRDFGPIVYADAGMGILIAYKNLNEEIGLFWFTQITPELWEQTFEKIIPNVSPQRSCYWAMEHAAEKWFKQKLDTLIEELTEEAEDADQ